jgi:hypothetical protein
LWKIIRDKSAKVKPFDISSLWGRFLRGHSFFLCI